MHCKKILSFALAGSLVFMAGCDRTVESGTYRLNVYPSLGKIQDAKVWIYAANNKTRIAKGVTGTTGHIGVFPGGGVGPAVVRVFSSTDVNSQYFDESLGGYISMPSGQGMHALVPSKYGNYAVTPLTELAYQIAINLDLFPLTAREVNALNERVRAMFAPELKSILSPPTILGALPDCPDPEAGTCLQDTQADRYALRLMALARLGDGQTRPMLSVMNALREDILDSDGDNIGVIDSLDRNGDSMTTPYDTTTLIDDMNSWLSSLAATYGSSELQAAVASDSEYPDISLTINMNNIDDGSNFTGCGAGDSALPDSVKGKTITMTFDQSDVAAPYDDNSRLSFTFCSNGQLRLRADYTVVDNNFETDVVDSIQTDYIWRQVSTGLVYELVTMNDSLFEVNVYGNYGSDYYGRFAP